MKITTRCPASCGELIQGWIEGSEKLISYGIDCYSQVTLQEGHDKRQRGYSKAYRMLDKVLRYYGYKEKEGKNLILKIASDIPRGKGMASSTADLAATALAVASFLGKQISETEIAKLCIELEPTDSIVFSDVTLLDHLKGKTIKGFGSFPESRVLMLEGRGAINTLSFRRTNRDELLKKNDSLLKQAMDCFQKGIRDKDLNELGRAATISALAHQEILPKAGLDELREEALRYGAAGINVAHSGTVVGVLYSEDSFDKERFKANISNRPYMKDYISFKDYKIVAGGARLHI